MELIMKYKYNNKISQITKIFAKRMELLRKFGEEIDNITQRYVELYTKLFPILEFQQHILEEIETMKEPSYLEFYEKYGWLDWMAWDAFMSLYYEYKEGKDSFLDDFYKYLSEPEAIKEITELLESSKVCSRRMKILRKILEFHVNGDYTVSIPLAIIQIEGIIRDLAVLNGILENKDNPQYRIVDEKYKLDKKGNKIKVSFAELCIELFGNKEKIIVKEISHPVTKKLTEEIYTPDIRHPIIHGNAVDYEDRILSCHLIAIIISLANRAVDIERKSQIVPYWEPIRKNKE
jgi:hypothetical protein